MKKITNKTKTVLLSFYISISDDILFWFLIDSLFLTEVKGLSTTNYIDLLFIGSLAGLIGKVILYKVIVKFSEITSIRISALMFLTASILFTFGTHFYTFVVAQVIYVIAPLFQSMAQPYIKKYTEQLKCPEEYSKIFARADSLYSGITLILSLMSGFIFSTNPYIAMAICIIFCLISLTISCLLKKVKTKKQSAVVQSRKSTINRSPVNRLIVIFCLFYVCMYIYNNASKLTFQDISQLFVDASVYTYMFSILMIVNRVGRILSGILFTFRNKQVKKSIYNTMSVIILASAIILILSKFAPNYTIFCIMMYIPMLAMAMLYSPVQITVKENILCYCNEAEKTKVIVLCGIFSSLFQTIFTWIATQLENIYGVVAINYVELILALLFFGIYVLWRHALSHNKQKIMEKICKKNNNDKDKILQNLIYLYMHYGCVKYKYPSIRKIKKDCKKYNININDSFDILQNISKLFEEFELEKICDMDKRVLYKFVENHPVLMLDESDSNNKVWRAVYDIDSEGVIFKDSPANQTKIEWDKLSRFSKAAILNIKEQSFLNHFYKQKLKSKYSSFEEKASEQLKQNTNS